MCLSLRVLTVFLSIASRETSFISFAITFASLVCLSWTKISSIDNRVPTAFLWHFFVLNRAQEWWIVKECWSSDYSYQSAHQHYDTKHQLSIFPHMSFLYRKFKILISVLMSCSFFIYWAWERFLLVLVYCRLRFVFMPLWTLQTYKLPNVKWSPFFRCYRHLKNYLYSISLCLDQPSLRTLPLILWKILRILPLVFVYSRRLFLPLIFLGNRLRLLFLLFPLRRLGRFRKSLNYFKFLNFCKCSLM